MRHTSFGLLLILLLSTSISAKTPSLPHQNENVLSVSRYVDVLPGPTNAQINPMEMVLPHISFKNNIKSVGQAINYLLSDTGYKLTQLHPDKRVLKLFRLPLPKIHRNMGPLKLWQALSVLAGEPWSLSVDPISRLVSFELPDNFKSSANHIVSRQQIVNKTVNKTVVTKSAHKQVVANTKSHSRKQAMRILESKRRALKDRKNKARLVKANARKQRPVKKIIKKRSLKNKLNDANYQISWSDLPKVLR